VTDASRMVAMTGSLKTTGEAPDCVVVLLVSSGRLVVAGRSTGPELQRSDWHDSSWQAGLEASFCDVSQAQDALQPRYQTSSAVNIRGYVN